MSLVDYKVDGSVALVTLTNPPANAYSYAMMRELDAAVLEARMNDEVHVLVLTGQGDKFFCAGADIAMLEKMTPSVKYSFCLHANETLMRLENTPKLVIAALNGHTMGGGLEVAMAADLRLGRKDSGKVGLPEIQLGVLPGTGGTQRLVRLLGRAKAIELMTSGAAMSMDEAHALGLVNRLLPREGFMDEVMKIARSFTPPHKASLAAGLIKRAVVSGGEMSFADGLALERELQQRLFASSDAREGLEAYVQKRPPQFSGR